MPRNGIRTVLHPGFAKTATTSLQRNLFARHPELFHLGRPAPTPELEWAIHAIAHADSTAYDRQRVRNVIEAARQAAQPGRTIVLSNENFTLYEATDRGLVAERLADLFPQARVLFTIRRQQDMLRAWYLQKLEKYLKGGHYIDFATWLEMKRKEPHKSILSCLDFWPIVRRYAELFGSDRIRILLFEDLVADPPRFVADLAAFLEVDRDESDELLREGAKNPTLTREYFGFFRIFGPWLPSRLARKLGNRMVGLPGRRLRIPLDEQTFELVHALCAEGNGRLAEAFALDLEARNYPLPSNRRPHAPAAMCGKNAAEVS